MTDGYPQNICITNMLAKASELGCSTPDPVCLCKNVNFGYGIRDCSNAVCDAADAAAVIAYGTNYCSCESTSIANQPIEC